MAGGKRGNPNWVKGMSSPNPGGNFVAPRDSAELDIRKLAQSFSAKAILTMAAIMTNTKVQPATRLTAADLLLKRAYGNPITPTVNKNIDVPLDFAEMSDAAIAANAGRLDALIERSLVASQVKGNGTVQ